MLTHALLLAILSCATGGDRLFDTSVRYAAGEYPSHRYLRDLALRDLDGDGDPDAVMVRRGGFVGAPIGLTVMENTGGGVFGPPVHFDVPGTGSSDGFEHMVLADFDGDGDEDAAVARPGGFADEGAVAFFRRDDGLSFTYMTTVMTSGDGSFAVDAADLDGDVDVAVTLPGGGFGRDLAILRNDGAWSFAVRPLIDLGAAPARLASGDLDGDGDVDLVVACRDATIRVLENDGSATFALTSRSTGGTASSRCDVALGDVDADGDLDIVSSRGITPGQSTYAISRNDGSGVFASWEAKGLPPFMTQSSIELADVSGDGMLDVLVASVDETINGVWTLAINDGSGSMPPVGMAERNFGGEAINAIAADDVDGDGIVDIVTLGGSSMQLDVFLNAGDHDFRPGTSYDAAGGHNDLAAGDLDGDGDLDVVTSSYFGVAQIQVSHNDGTGGLVRMQTIAGAAPSGLNLGDLDGDGDLDLAWVENRPPYEAFSALNLGDGTFAAPVEHLIQCSGPGDTSLQDLDGDGRLDLVVVNRLAPFAGFVGVSLGNGDGTFAPDTLFWVGTLARGVAGADFDGDGDVDLAVTIWTPGSCCSDQVGLLRNHGDATFADVEYAQVDFDPWDIVAVDLDGDGDVDLATCNTGAATSIGGQNGDETISVLLNRGDGTFDARVDHPGSFSPNLLGTQSITTGDPDRDGDVDLLVSNAGSHDVSFFGNQGDGTFEPFVRYGTVGAALEVLCIDLTGDGVEDLVTTAYTSSPDGDEVLTVIDGIGPPEVVGDIDGDGVVDGVDLGIVLSSWGRCSGSCDGDLDGNGSVDGADLALVLANWSS